MSPPVIYCKSKKKRPYLHDEYSAILINARAGKLLLYKRRFARFLGLKNKHLESPNFTFLKIFFYIFVPFSIQIVFNFIL